MSVRGKLLLAQVPLAIALAVLGMVAFSSVTSLGRHSQTILQENYRSVLAAQRMRAALEQLHEAALVSRTAPLDTKQMGVSRELFERELVAAEGNITEIGEREALEGLRATWKTYEDRLGELAQASPDTNAAIDPLRSAATAVRMQAQLLLDLNQDAMVRKGDHARREAARIGTLVIAAAVAAFLLGALLTGMVTTRLVQPLELLARTVNHMREGDFGTRVNVSGNDEVAQLANAVNSLANRLSQYRSSSLGELLLAQEASQAAIDSLPDPVLVFDSNGNVLNINKAAETLLRIDLETKLDDPNAGVDAAVRECLTRVRLHTLSGKGAYVPRGFEEAVRVAAADGEYYFLPRATPVHSEEGAVKGATVILQDVTRLRRVDNLRSNLVSTIAHEFRTPLTSLRMAIHLCLEQAAGPLTERQADILQAARDDCERLQAIVDELLDLVAAQSHLDSDSGARPA